ncbi:uncharacterized protein LOC141533778 [Cotesia typhae]|uniref:uncharacterized protein LOC141533778 n=1 Tax=Cotesia typhae TaxID=2053667 RepID=UPI003D68E8B9
MQRCRDKLKKLYDEWRILLKHRNRSEVAVKKQNEFSCSLKKLFDIAPSNVFEMVDENSKEFLNNQRSDERIGFIANIKMKYDDDEIGVKKLEKQLDFEKRKLESEKEKSLFDKNVELLSSQGSAQSVSSGEVYIPTTAGQLKSRNTLLEKIKGSKKNSKFFGSFQQAVTLREMVVQEIKKKEIVAPSV